MRFGIAAAILVIAIHTYPLADLNSTADYLAAHVVCRIAVPFFFMASGFFLFPAGTDPLDALPRFLKRSACIYAAAIALYIPVNLYTGYFKTEQLLPAMLQDIFFDGTFYHLWYLPAGNPGGMYRGILSPALRKQRCVCRLRSPVSDRTLWRQLLRHRGTRPFCQKFL